MKKPIEIPSTRNIWITNVLILFDPWGHMTSKQLCTNVDETSWRSIDKNTTMFSLRVPAEMFSDLDHVLLC